MRLYFTGTQKEGDSQTEPRLSTGGYISGSEIPNASLNNLFGEMSQYTLEKQVVEYRAVALKNTTGAAVALSKLFYDNVSNNPLVNIRMAVVTLAQDSCGWYMERTPSINAKPINAVFVDNRGLSNAIDMPNINNEEYIGIWIERSFNMAAITDSLSCATLIAAFEAEPIVQVSTIETVADVADSLNNTYWLLDTPKNKFFIWYDTGTGVIPTIPNREPIKVTIVTGDTADDVASKTSAQLNSILTPRGELTSVAASNVITITNILPGPSLSPAPGTSGFTTAIVTQGSSGGQEKVEDIALTISW